ncbi:hypothetical protein J2Z21_009459 [Streptomyces griseochromogenes]|uniref:Uncharacterized protein n=1 Tax=Streptomyces griseochromogenes TaxID=68214 RepID=A0ABS4M9T7_9ACTN|nr:hypothetical protein [Streptomyces griseochromogenes]MBP2056441.1 hypothetical protein [Streptomyces griseochromogenes]
MDAEVLAIWQPLKFQPAWPSQMMSRLFVKSKIWRLGDSAGQSRDFRVRVSKWSASVRTVSRVADLRPAAGPAAPPSARYEG